MTCVNCSGTGLGDGGLPHASTGILKMELKCEKGSTVIVAANTNYEFVTVFKFPFALFFFFFFKLVNTLIFYQLKAGIAN